MAVEDTEEAITLAEVVADMAGLHLVEVIV